MTVNELLDLYLDGLDADGHLSAKTRFDYRHYADDYVRPYLGNKRVRDVTPEVILAWQRKLTKEGGTKRKIEERRQAPAGQSLSPNTIRLARSPLSGAFKLAMTTAAWSPTIPTDPGPAARAPSARSRSTGHPSRPASSSALMEGDRTWPLWAFLLGSGLRIGELVWLRWPNVDLETARRAESSTSPRPSATTSFRRRARAATPSGPSTSTTGWSLCSGVNARSKPRSRWRPRSTWTSEYVFTKERGGHYHPQRTLSAARRLHRRSWASPADRARPPAHLRHSHAGQRRATEGGGRAAGTR